MKKVLLLSLLLTFIMAAASQPLSAKDADCSSPETLIRAIYRDHQPWKEKKIALDNRKMLSKYFDPELSELFMKEDECARTTHEICNLDFDPLLDAQDFENTPLKLSIRRKTPPPNASYAVTFTNIGRRTLIYQLRKTAKGWRVRDIIYPEGFSLRKILSHEVDF
jgi:hypothetical protein